MKISERNFLVTGGGSGLGEATARALAAAGGNVVIADIDQVNGARVRGPTFSRSVWSRHSGESHRYLQRVAAGSTLDDRQ
jgi:NAD(P)-dependent dehydrogenase (short-subunit alcohol dehydrogenase family)